jgi:hypothetical protein
MVTEPIRCRASRDRQQGFADAAAQEGLGLLHHQPADQVPIPQLSPELGKNRANCDGCGSRWDDEQTAPVGSFPPNSWGLYDMAGNVGEWTCSMRDPDPANSFKRCDSIYKTRRRVYRNGGWSDGPKSITASSRDWNVAKVKFHLQCNERQRRQWP